MATTMPRSAALYDTAGTLALDWSGLYDEHAPRLHRIAARRVGRDHASDVVQEIFVRAYRNRHSLDPSRPVGAWLSTIALRASTDALRRRSARPEVPVDEERETVALGDDIDDEFENMVRREGIKTAFDSLPERQQQVFRMLAIDGLSQEEAAREVGISTDAVKSAFARAKHTFKETYQAFSERMGVFGGAVGSIAWLRRHVQRAQGLVTEHVGAISMAAATVTVVAIATVPTARPTPTRADDRVATTPRADIADQSAASINPLIEAGTSTRSTPVESAPAPDSDAGASADAAPPQTRPSADGNVAVDATAEVGRSGSGAGVGIAAESDGPQRENTTTAGVFAEDCGGATNGTFCLVVETAIDPMS